MAWHAVTLKEGRNSIQEGGKEELKIKMFWNAFGFEPSSSLLAQYHPSPWISQRALRLRERRNNWKCTACSRSWVLHRAEQNPEE